MKDWENIQIGLAQKGVRVDSPEALFDWIEQTQSAANSWRTVAESLLVQQQQLMSLLGAIVQDTEAAATSIIQELAMVDGTVERLDHLLNGLEAQVDQLGSVSSSQFSNQLEAVFQQFLKNNTELTDFFAGLAQELLDVRRDISAKTCMLYAQTQFQDIVRQKAERGMDLIQSTIATLKLLSTDADMKVIHDQLQASIIAYKQIEALHVAFHHSGADISHHGGNMTIDLF